MRGRAGHPFQRARLRYDPTFALEVGYCYDHGIPHSEYLERWSTEDRSKVSALTLDRGERCPSCGTAEWEWGLDFYAYEPMHSTCRGCQQKEVLAKATEADNTPMPPGTTIRLFPKETAETLRQRAIENPPQRPRMRR